MTLLQLRITKNSPTTKKDVIVVKQQQSDDEEKEFLLGMSLHEFVTTIVDYLIIGAILYAMSEDTSDDFAEHFRSVPRLTIVYAFVHYVFYKLDIHGKYGIWKTSEPHEHMTFTMKSVWIISLYSMGVYASDRILNIKTGGSFSTPIRLTEEQLGPFSFLMAPENPSTAFNLLMGLVLFYVCDFWRYWSHRWGHMDPFYRTFPFAHAHHHNQVFINPLTFVMSPLWHFAAWSTYVPCAVACWFGYWKAAQYAWVWTLFPTVTQHLGCDPLPWLTRINHKYCYGALPWIPLYHSYHHLHIIKSGNFGNTTVLFDYLYGTVSKESIYHIEHGEPTPFIKKFFKNPNLNETFQRNFEGARKNRLDMNF